MYPLDRVYGYNGCLKGRCKNKGETKIEENIKINKYKRGKEEEKKKEKKKGTKYRRRKEEE